MGNLNSLLGPAKGLVPADFDCELYVCNTAQVDAAVVVGAVMQLDHLWTSTDTTNSTPGETGSSFVNVVDPATAELDTGTFVVAKEAIAKGATGAFRLKGRVQCLVFNTTAGDLTAGTPLGPVNDEVYLSDAPVAGTKIVARLDETSAAADNGTTLRWCWFDGE